MYAGGTEPCVVNVDREGDIYGVTAMKWEARMQAKSKKRDDRAKKRDRHVTDGANPRESTATS